MTPQVYGTKKSNATRRVERYLKERRIDYHFVDLTQRGPSAGELTAIVRAVGDVDSLIDTQSREYRRRNLEHLDFDPIEEIESTPGILRQPIVRTEKGVRVDPADSELSEIL